MDKYVITGLVLIAVFACSTLMLACSTISVHQHTGLSRRSLLMFVFRHPRMLFDVWPYERSSEEIERFLDSGRSNKDAILKTCLNLNQVLALPRAANHKSTVESLRSQLKELRAYDDNLGLSFLETDLEHGRLENRVYDTGPPPGSS